MQGLDYHPKQVRETRETLSSVARSPFVRQISNLSLPQIEELVDRVAVTIPAGNVPALILGGLARLPERHLSPATARTDIHRLLEKTVDTTVYGTVFAGPAAVIWGYQMLLKLAGKDPDSAFPDGTWQFYAGYALREDTARHTTETHGFDTVLRHHQLTLTPADRITAWILAAIQVLHQYDALLKNEWRERVYTDALAQLMQNTPQATSYALLYRDWEQQRPYGRGADADSSSTYPAYRRRKFNAFLERALRDVPPAIRHRWVEQVRQARAQDFPAYRRQMSLLAYLEAGAYTETVVPIPLVDAHVGIIYGGHYYLIPACSPESETPAAPELVRTQVAAILADPAETAPTTLVPLARMRRATLATLRTRVPAPTRAAWDRLRLAPILFNVDGPAAGETLNELRQAERGLGDQAMTIIDQGDSILFDQSHIFFDGTWGAALAEIVTREALSWARYLHHAPTLGYPSNRPASLTFSFSAEVDEAPSVMREVGAETDLVNLEAILALRRLFKVRNDLIHLTVNDILVLYRALHTLYYRPEPDLVETLSAIAATEAVPAAALALDALKAEGNLSPTVLIPVDASQYDPRARVHPLSFTVPLTEMELPDLHRRTLAALAAYRAGSENRGARYAEFDRLQRRYLAILAGFGALSSRAKAAAARGESISTGSISLLAHLPPAVQRRLDRIPGHVDLLNDILKGREVFSNIGAVARTSSLTRFMTAKDDNDQKTFAWGILTDADNVMRITLRDFRPHVSPLVAAGHSEIARRLAQDYLDDYAHGLNRYVRELRQVTLASRETRSLPERG